MKVKTQMLQYEMRKLKGGMRGSKLSTRGFILWFGLPQRRPYIHVVEALTKNIASGNQVSSVNTITVTLIPLSTKELAHTERGSPRSLYKVVVTAPHQAGGSMTCRRATKCSKGPAHRNTYWFTLEPATRHNTLHFTLSKELILALTLTKLVLSLRI